MGLEAKGRSWAMLVAPTLAFVNIREHSSRRAALCQRNPLVVGTFDRQSAVRASVCWCSEVVPVVLDTVLPARQCDGGAKIIHRQFRKEGRASSGTVLPQRADRSMPPC